MELTILPNALAGQNLKDFRKEIKEKKYQGISTVDQPAFL